MSNDQPATMELVFRAVDDLGKELRAHFDAVNIRLDQLNDLPRKVGQIETDVNELKLWKKAYDDQQEAERYRRNNTRPMVIIGLLGLLVPLVILLLGQAHGL